MTDLNEYPYFIYPAVMALREGSLSPEETARLRRIVAANVGDIPSLRLMLGIDPEEFASFYPDMAAPELSTTDTIDSFLSRFGQSDAPLPQAAAAIPLPETAPYFAESLPEGKPTKEKADKLIKNHDYQGALEIIQQLILINPEKSIYFADQIRFLKKLILNEARKNASAGTVPAGVTT